MGKVKSKRGAGPIVPVRSSAESRATAKLSGEHSAPSPEFNDRKRGWPRIEMRDDPSGEQFAAVLTCSHAVIRDAFGVAEDDLADGLIGQIINGVGAKRADVERQANFALAAVRGIRPADATEAMLATQMVTVHAAMMKAARRVGAATDLGQLEVHTAALNKLARTYTIQVEALKRYRSKGEQRVYVERVNIESGAQAIVGTVNKGGEDGQKG